MFVVDKVDERFRVYMDIETIACSAKSNKTNLSLINETYPQFIKTEKWPHQHIEQIQIHKIISRISSSRDSSIDIKHADLNIVQLPQLWNDQNDSVHIQTLTQSLKQVQRQLLIPQSQIRIGQWKV